MSNANFRRILAQYSVTEDQALLAAQNADQSVFGHRDDVTEAEYAAAGDNQEWCDVFAASLGNFEEENVKEESAA